MATTLIPDRSSKATNRNNDWTTEAIFLSTDTPQQRVARLVVLRLLVTRSGYAELASWAKTPQHCGGV